MASWFEDPFLAYQEWKNPAPVVNGDIAKEAAYKYQTGQIQFPEYIRLRELPASLDAGYGALVTEQNAQIEDSVSISGKLNGMVSQASNLTGGMGLLLLGIVALMVYREVK